jgi:hypothetical protein
MPPPISHALVLPDRDFESWLNAARPYMQAFERVAVIRSPAGNDLNRFRDITAVQTPLVWHDDNATEHIRRAYPMVVRIDTIAAQNPTQLAAALQTRISAKDRFGEKQNNPPHIFDRFVLDWPTDSRPARISRPFALGTGQNGKRHEGIDIATTNSAQIVAAAAGQVTRVVKNNDALNYGPYVQVTTVTGGQSHITTYAGLKNIAVSAGQHVKTGDRIALAAGSAVKLVLQSIAGGMSGFPLPNVIDPTLMIYWQGMRVRPTVNVLRVRSHAGTFGSIIGTVTPADSIETAEMHGRTLAKLGIENEWVRIRYPGARDAYTAAWFLEALSTADPVEGLPGINIPGMNLDIDHHLGAPPPEQLGTLGWVRLVYNVSLNPNFHDSRRHGNTDLNFTFNRYRPLLERYASAGIKVVLVLTHQTFGEGQGYVWPQMNSSRWREFTVKYAAILRQIASQFVGRNLVYAYQIWNEQDTPPAVARAAVALPPADYAHILAESIKAIRAADPHTRIITGGHVTGPDNGGAYARATLNALPASLHPDGIAFHPYGRGPAGSPFSYNGTINEEIQKWTRVMPGKPVWITEWGVLDRQGDNSVAQQVTQYATGVMNIIRQQFPRQVAAAIWYAWADSMDNGYGMVRSNGQPRQPLYDAFVKS